MNNLPAHGEEGLAPGGSLSKTRLEPRPVLRDAISTSSMAPQDEQNKVDSDRSNRSRVLIVGFGETGVLVAMRLPKTAEVSAISTKLCLVSGQELGTRLTAPDEWKRDYVTEFRRFRKLDKVRIIEGRALSLDPTERKLEIEGPDGAASTLDYDILVIASGITNGFWRDDGFRTQSEIDAQLSANAAQLATAQTIAIVGGGPSGVSAAANLAAAHPDTEIHLFHSGGEPLPGYHPQAKSHMLGELKGRGIHLHPHTRAILPEPERMQCIDTGDITFEGGQPSFTADAIIWATGAARPNSTFLPNEMLNAQGYVLTDPMLRVPGYPGIFAIGDVAATDPNRSSARNWAYRILAHNIAAVLKGEPEAMKRFDAPENRWGSIIGLQSDGLTIYQADGKRTRMSRWVVRALLYPIAVRRMIYCGVKPTSS